MSHKYEQGRRKETGEVRRLRPLCVEPITRKELMGGLGLRHEDQTCLVPALKAGLIE